MERRLSPAVIAAVVFTLIAWASAFVVIRGTNEHISGGSLALGRLAIGALLLLIPLALSRSWIRPTAREWALIAGLGVVWFGAYNIALNLAEATVDAGTTSMLVGFGPILIALGAGLLLREGITSWLILGAVVALAGVILIAVGSGAITLGDPGVLWGLAAALTYAAGVLFQKEALRRLPAAQVTWLGCTIGMLACLPFSGQLLDELAVAPISAILGAVYLGVVSTALAFSTWAYALARMPASQLGITTYLVPPLVVILALVFFGEMPTWLAIGGGVLCLVGVAISRRRPRLSAPLAARGPEPRPDPSPAQPR